MITVAMVGVIIVAIRFASSGNGNVKATTIASASVIA
jgi:hypothetical protein